MKKAMMLLAVAGMMASAYGAETAKDKANDTKRSAKKGMHKVQEAVCAEGDAKCAAKKVGHRASEATETVKDKAKSE